MMLPSLRISSYRQIMNTSFSTLDFGSIYYAQMDFLFVASYLLFLAGGAYQYRYHKSLMKNRFDYSLKCRPVFSMTS